MNFAALFSGGKDSTFAIFKALEQGHKISCLISMHPKEDDSMLFHFPTHELIGRIAKALEIPLVEGYCKTNQKENEEKELTLTIIKAIKSFPIDALVNGAIASKFQLQVFENICKKLDLELYSPLWNVIPDTYYKNLFESKFEFMITHVAAMGLDENWLGKTVNRKNYNELKKNSLRYHFNITFEGGEAETLVLDCPVYKNKIVVKKYKKKWDGVRGTFEILDVDLVQK